MHILKALINLTQLCNHLLEGIIRKEKPPGIVFLHIHALVFNWSKSTRHPGNKRSGEESFYQDRGEAVHQIVI